VPDHAVQPEGYLLAYGNQALLDRLRNAGRRAEIDTQRTRVPPLIFRSDTCVKM
jgi:hypothetical protein